MILFKQLVTADTKYPFPNQSNCVIFDVNNDTPYNMGVSFGKDTGPDNADYFTTPHSVLTGIGPKGNAPSLNNSRWNGTIYIYTETPLGTGATNLGSSPAFQITMIGYPAGYQPISTTSLSRMTATPNAVTTVSGPATSIQNDGNAAGTRILETSIPGTPTNQQATNDGIWVLNILIGGVLHQFLKTQTTGHVLLLGQSGDTVEMQGNATVNNDLIVGSNAIDTRFQLLAWANLDTTIPLAARANTSTQSADLFQALNSVGVPLAKIDKNGVLTTPTVNVTTGSITRISKFTALVNTTPTFFNHGLGVIPDFIVCVPDGTGAGPFSTQVDYASLTTSQAKLTGSASFNAQCLAIKF